jgi:MFS family permease
LFVAGYLTHGGLSRTSFSGLYAVATLCSAGWVLFLGRLAERVRLRRLWLSVAVALAGACWLASVSHGLILVVASLALLRMFGQVSLTLLGTVITNRNFGRSLGKAVAASRSGHAVASVALPPLIATLIVVVGWSGTYRILGAALVVLLVPASLLVNDRPIPVSPGGAVRLPTGDPDRVVSPALWRSVRLPGLDLPTRHAGWLLVTLSVSPFVTTAVSIQAVSLMARRGVGWLCSRLLVLDDGPSL